MTLLQTLYKQHCCIEGIKEILRSRHQQTHMHCERMVLLANRFAKACHLEEDKHSILLYSAMFHDIGKIGIPDSILMHDGSLDEAQHIVMQQHSSMGEVIVRTMQLKAGDTIAQHVRHHHEHFDGGGYPDRLKGNAIPLLARMLTILDSYDALRELRPYREALSHEQATAIMQDESGVVHDPELLKRFLDIEGIENIGEEYSREE